MSRVMFALSGLPAGIGLARDLVPHIHNAFVPFGIDIEFYQQDNVVLSSDPELTANSWPKLVKGLQTQSGYKTPAHLVVTQYPPGFDRSIDGQLYDTKYRGVAVVYTDVDLYGSGGAASSPGLMAQVCVHEIGHMFDLTHGLAQQSNYASCMSPASIRQHWTLRDAWNGAIAEAQLHGEPPITMPTSLRIYPFNGACRHELTSVLANPTKLPFGGPFSGGSGSAAGDRNLSLTLEIEPDSERDTISIGAGLYATVVLRNHANFIVEIPLHLGPEYGSMRVAVMNPDGQTTLFRPHKLVCSSARRSLAPGASAYCSVALIQAYGHSLFARPGPHICRVEILDLERIPKIRLAVAEMAVEVVDEGAATALNNELTRALAERRISRLKLEKAARDAGEVGVADHVRWLKAKRFASWRQRKKEFESIAAGKGPRRIRHRAARRLAVEQLLLGASPEEVSDRLAQIFHDSADSQLFEAVNRSAAGIAACSLGGAIQ